MIFFLGGKHDWVNNPTHSSSLTLDCISDAPSPLLPMTWQRHGFEKYQRQCTRKSWHDCLSLIGCMNLHSGIERNQPQACFFVDVKNLSKNRQALLAHLYQLIESVSAICHCDNTQSSTSYADFTSIVRKKHSQEQQAPSSGRGYNIGCSYSTPV